MTESGDTSHTITPQVLAEKIQQGDLISVLDVRDRDEFEAWHIDGQGVVKVQLPHVRVLQAEVTDNIDSLVAELGLSEPIVVVCAVGEASSYVAEVFQDHGIAAVNLAGGMDAWATVLLRVDVSPWVRQYYRPATGCLSYLVHSGGDGLLVDPLRAFTDQYLNDAATQNIAVTQVVDTHIHADHVSGARAISNQVDATPILPARAKDRDIAFDAVFIEDGDTITVGNTKVRAIHAPGHTSEMTALHVDDVMLSGDSLFLESVARPDLEAGADGAPDLAHQLYETLHERLLVLPDSTIIAPGHVGQTTLPQEDGHFTARLGTLRETIELLNLDEPTFVDRVIADMPPRPANFEQIIAINKGLSESDTADSFDLELGPNNCAVSV